MFHSDKLYEELRTEIASLHRELAELKREKADLELLVAERTSALTRANEKLSESIKEQQQRTFEMTLLNYMSDLLHACRTEKEAYQVVISVCKQLFYGDSGYLCMIGDSRSKLDIVASWGNVTPEVEVLKIDDCWALRRGKTHVVESSEIGPLCSHLSQTSQAFSYLCEPIIAQGETLGVMHLRIGNCPESMSDKALRRLLDSKQLILVRVIEHYSLSLVNLRLRETLRKESIQDPLTGLYNRRYMEKNLEKELSRCKRHNFPLTVIMMDIDHFKTLNDTYGHAVGDAILQKLGKFLREHIRHEDIACRYGGDEFAMILPQASLETVKQRTEQMHAKLKEFLIIPYQDSLLEVTISMGIAGFPGHGETSDKILDAADRALYRAKKKGRDWFEIADKTE